LLTQQTVNNKVENVCTRIPILEARVSLGSIIYNKREKIFKFKVYGVNNDLFGRFYMLWLG